VEAYVGHSHAGCGPDEDSMWMTAVQMLVTTRSRDLSCGRPKSVHRRAWLSTVPVHVSSTEHDQRHLHVCRLSTESTGPMTTMRPKRDGSSPEYLGTNTSNTGNTNCNARETRGTTRQVLAEAPGGTKVNPHLCKTH